MVNFDNETTISKPPREVVALVAIEKLYNFLEADEAYTKDRMHGAAAPLATCRSRLRSLFLLAQPMLQRHLKATDYDLLRDGCLNINEELEADVVLDHFVKISEMLDKLELTRLDTKKKFDRQRIEESNKAQGY